MADRVVVQVICVQQNAQGGKDPDRWGFLFTKVGRGEMTKAPISLQDLRRRIYRKAKSDKAHRFWGLFGHVAKSDTLAEAYHQAKRNGGAPGLDGQTFADIEAGGIARFLADIQADLLAGTYQPQPHRAVDIPKKNGKVRRLQIPMCPAYCTSSQWALGMPRVYLYHRSQ